jgi:hypothetical protein
MYMCIQEKQLISTYQTASAAASAAAATLSQRKTIESLNLSGDRDLGVASMMDTNNTSYNQRLHRLDSKLQMVEIPTSRLPMEHAV